jgi:hypothetical protein
VSNFPVLLSRVVRSEQAIVDAIPDFPQAGGNNLCEPFLVADFIQKVVGTNEHSRPSKQMQPKYWALTKI